MFYTDGIPERKSADDKIQHANSKITIVYV